MIFSKLWSASWSWVGRNWKLLTGSYCANRWSSDRNLVLTCDELRNRFVSDLGVDDSGGHAGVGDPPPCSPSCQRLWLAARDPLGLGSRVCGRPTWVQTYEFHFTHQQVLCFITTFDVWTCWWTCCWTSFMFRNNLFQLDFVFDVLVKTQKRAFWGGPGGGVFGVHEIVQKTYPLEP